MQKDTISCIVQLLSHFKLYMIDDDESIDLPAVTRIKIVTIMQTHKTYHGKSGKEMCVAYFSHKQHIDSFNIF